MATHHDPVKTILGVNVKSLLCWWERSSQTALHSIDHSYFCHSKWWRTIQISAHSVSHLVTWGSVVNCIRSIGWVCMLHVSYLGLLIFLLELVKEVAVFPNAILQVSSHIRQHESDFQSSPPDYLIAIHSNILVIFFGIPTWYLPSLVPGFCLRFKKLEVGKAQAYPPTYTYMYTMTYQKSVFYSLVNVRRAVQNRKNGTANQCGRKLVVLQVTPYSSCVICSY